MPRKAAESSMLIVIGPDSSSTRKLIETVEWAEKMVAKLIAKKTTPKAAWDAMQKHKFYAELGSDDKAWAKKNILMIAKDIYNGKYNEDEAVFWFSKGLY